MEAQRRQEERERERRQRQERQRELMQRQRRIVQANLRARHRGRVEREHNGVLTDTFLVSICFSVPVCEERVYVLIHVSHAASVFSRNLVLHFSQSPPPTPPLPEFTPLLLTPPQPPTHTPHLHTEALTPALSRPLTTPPLPPIPPSRLVPTHSLQAHDSTHPELLHILRTTNM